MHNGPVQRLRPQEGFACRSAQRTTVVLQHGRSESVAGSLGRGAHHQGAGLALGRYASPLHRSERINHLHQQGGRPDGHLRHHHAGDEPTQAPDKRTDQAQGGRNRRRDAASPPRLSHPPGMVDGRSAEQGSDTARFSFRRVNGISRSTPPAVSSTCPPRPGDPNADGHVVLQIDCSPPSFTDRWFRKKSSPLYYFSQFVAISFPGADARRGPPPPWGPVATGLTLLPTTNVAQDNAMRVAAVGRRSCNSRSDHSGDIALEAPSPWPASDQLRGRVHTAC